ncbi:MAG TPA: PP2C family protein-serine/threonine phosphatase [Geminicoccus sp.]|jgi:sigma-B regulation protein RsbU (phosphoserine phosphatase)|uniref:PP2C family protein-serine/threonine phosphatase n=1 Tax=Geminicoccus sp. TaxID=2024832 RepID=UPI002E340208|nr:PP2C family protein-serine/threonine phosphatase [Geminicoccus sp.]HEX2525897.1 PP2C family protein-serine/threonine phosphatase [Geminicoccus sp.]
MLLRVRLVLVLLLVIAAITGLVATAASIIADGVGRDANRTERTAQLKVWEVTVRAEAAPLVQVLRGFADDPVFSQALAMGDRLAAAKRLDEQIEAAGPDHLFSRVDLIGSDGQLLWTSHGQAEDRAMVDVRRLAPSARAGEGMWVGLQPQDGGQLTPTVVMSLDGGHLAMSRPLGPTLVAFTDTYGGSAYLMTADNALVAATDERPWSSLQGAYSTGDIDPVIEDPDGRVHKARSVQIFDMSDTPAGFLIALRDATAERERRWLVTSITVVGCTLVVLVVIGMVYGWLRHSLVPLEELAVVVQAIARGNLLLSPDQPRRNDEIGGIARAVVVLREGAISLERMRFRHSRARRRSEALIREKMQELAATLDTQARGELARDLAEIEAKSGAADADADGTTPLAVAFDRMTARVVAQYHELSALLAERTRDLERLKEAVREREELVHLRQELSIARALQLSTLPASFPAFPGRTDFDVYAAMRPAEEVGGDFYDFFLIDEDRIAVAIGDASGKGVAAAMFIAIARSLIKAACLQGSGPAEAMRFANDVLASDNPQMMFATALVAVLDTRTGQMKLANAGHNAPFIRRRDGTLDAIEAFLGPALGVSDQVGFDELTIDLREGDLLFLFTDGVTEAADRQAQFFDTEGLEVALAKLDATEPRVVVEDVQAGLDAFTDGAAQADDITMLALKLRGLKGLRAIAA